jgi:lipoprotein NlpI
MKRKDYPRAYDSYTAAIRYSPDLDQFYAYRGDILYDQEKYAEAIADYSKAVELNPGYSTAYNLRGLSYHSLGDDDKALADYGQAIEHNSQFARAYDNRGRLYLERGDLDKAADDLTAAIGIAPRFADALFDRGRTRFHQASYLQASDDLGAAFGLLPKNAYVMLWAYLARDRAGQPAREPLAGDAATLDRGEWPWPIVAAYLGQTDQAAVLAASRGNTDQQCEADFYFGAKTEATDPTVARALLEQAAAICPAHFIEAPAARLEIEKLSR